MTATFQYHNSWTHQIQFMIKLSDVFIKCFALFHWIQQERNGERASERSNKRMKEELNDMKVVERGIKKDQRNKWQTWCVSENLWQPSFTMLYEAFIQCRRKVLEPTEKFRIFFSHFLSFFSLTLPRKKNSTISMSTRQFFLDDGGHFALRCFTLKRKIVFSVSHIVLIVQKNRFEENAIK